MKKVYIGSDHAGYEHKQAIVNYLTKKNKYEIIDCGSQSEQSVDYTSYGLKVATSVSQNKDSLGILVCGTGIGMSIIANKVKGIRAALVYDPAIAKTTREHNDTNILALGGRTTKLETNFQIVDNFLNTNFEGGRHQLRIDKISEYEGENNG